MSNCSCGCGAAPKFVFSCSGAADVGEVADQSARALSREGSIKMFCLTGIGGKVSGIVKSTEAADKIVVIDGCSLNCGQKTLEEAGITEFSHVQLDELGFKKGTSPATPENIAKVVETVSRLVQE